ncbi:hypothetical protein BDQ94DRAFT_7071 [Aspergillus welwitschiae]|uniref:Uncharacterized protein n=1 Tax=Aspergillus welwitschiae TaxID=1341132 RepID=A0A3F3QK03_9EURO|nr:hypothetical protein BDQ94DRAFT_7071 [Aspergillus welwitschiae]RDH39613.1 hypothetical protein BDQ94DRAFT_7071 [Aspergillus welwitschiae]
MLCFSALCGYLKVKAVGPSNSWLGSQSFLHGLTCTGRQAVQVACQQGRVKPGLNWICSVAFRPPIDRHRQKDASGPCSFLSGAR